MGGGTHPRPQYGNIKKTQDKDMIKSKDTTTNLLPDVPYIAQEPPGHQEAPAQHEVKKHHCVFCTHTEFSRLTSGEARIGCYSLLESDRATKKQLENLKCMIRMRISLDTSDSHFTYYLIAGGVYSNIPGQPSQKLFDVCGVNKAKSVKITDEKYFINSQEVLFYIDPRSGKVLRTWQNPFTGETNEVFHIYNNPVNIPVFAAFNISPDFLNDDQTVLLNTCVPLAYPNPVSPDLYPESSAGDLYIASETFLTWANKKEAYSESFDSVPGLVGWNRTAPWLPFMRMGKRSGGLVYVSHSWKVANVGEIPADLESAIKDQFPKFYEDPLPVGTPNASSWKEYRKEMDRRRENGDSDVQLNNIDQSENVIANLLQVTTDAFDLLRNGKFHFNVTGKGTAVGSTERIPATQVTGKLSISSQVDTDEAIKLSIQYTLDKSYSKSHSKVNTENNSENGSEQQQAMEFEKPLKTQALCGQFDATVKLEDFTSLSYNGMKTINFPAKDLSDNTFGNFLLAFPGGETGKVCLTATLVASWQQSWLGDAPPNGYTVVNVCG